MENTPTQTSEPTIDELTNQQLIGFVQTGQPITEEVSQHLIAMTPEQRTELDATIPANGENFNPDRRQWVALMATRGSVLIERMTEQTRGKPGERPDMRQIDNSRGRHTRASVGHYMAHGGER